jgi:hypothetical protein
MRNARSDTDESTGTGHLPVYRIRVGSITASIIANQSETGTFEALRSIRRWWRILRRRYLRVWIHPKKRRTVYGPPLHLGVGAVGDGVPRDRR